MNDALIAIVIVIAAVIPVAASINYAYSAIVSSADISGQFNTFGNDVDELIWNHEYNSNDTSYSESGILGALDPLGAPLNPRRRFDIVHPSIAGAEAIEVEAVKFEKPLNAGRRNLTAEVFMIRRYVP